MTAAVDRVLSRVSPGQGGCWLFTGCVNRYGYGRVGLSRREGPALAHRIVYQALVGSIPSGLVIDHLCRVRRCVNPRHLEAVTQQVNVLRADGPSARCARQTECIHGHRFDADNTYRDAGGRRHCRRCNADRHRLAYRSRVGIAS